MAHGKEDKIGFGEKFNVPGLLCITDATAFEISGVKVMDHLSRRKFLTIFASLSLSHPLSLVYASAGKNKAAPSGRFFLTKHTTLWQL